MEEDPQVEEDGEKERPGGGRDRDKNNRGRGNNRRRLGAQQQQRYDDSSSAASSSSSSKDDLFFQQKYQTAMEDFYATWNSQSRRLNADDGDSAGHFESHEIEIDEDIVVVVHLLLA